MEENIKLMTNKECADYLDGMLKSALSFGIGRGNGKSTAVVRYVEAMTRAIYVLNNTPENKGDK